jgi:hypothetical protein
VQSLLDEGVGAASHERLELFDRGALVLRYVGTELTCRCDESAD